MKRPIRVVSYRRIFRTDWRLTRIWEFDLTKIIPGGVPVIGAAWVILAMFIVFSLSNVPPTEYALGILPGWLRYGTVAMLIGFWSQQEAPDGRPAHAYAVARMRLLFSGRGREEERWTKWEARLPVHWDDSGSVLHRGRVHGPAKVTVNVPATLGSKRKHMVVKADTKGEEKTEFVLCPGERAEVYG